MIEKTKQLVESKYTVENGYSASAKVRGHPACCSEWAWVCAWWGESRGPLSHTPLPTRWCTVIPTPSCADLASPLWLKRWLWGGRLQTGCQATSPHPSGLSLRRQVPLGLCLEWAGVGLASFGEGLLSWGACKPSYEFIWGSPGMSALGKL